MHTRINTLVSNSGLTKTEFAKRLGISQPFLSQLCSGVKIPSDRTISDICRIFDIQEDWLRYGLEPMRAAKSKEEEIAELVGHALNGSNEFKKAVIRMICSRTDEELKVLEDSLRTVYENIKKELPEGHSF